MLVQPRVASTACKNTSEVVLSTAADDLRACYINATAPTTAAPMAAMPYATKLFAEPVFEAAAAALEAAEVAASLADDAALEAADEAASDADDAAFEAEAEAPDSIDEASDVEEVMLPVLDAVDAQLAVVGRLVTSAPLQSAEAY